MLPLSKYDNRINEEYYLHALNLYSGKEKVYRKDLSYSLETIEKNENKNCDPKKISQMKIVSTVMKKTKKIYLAKENTIFSSNFLPFVLISPF